jgi:glycosyltransferase involved in cell wall biosynthesis
LIEENPTQAIAHPVTLVQCMFYGDPSRSGRGSSGGIATLLNELGNTIPEEAGGVVTLVLYDTERSPYPFVPVEQISKTHSIIRVPVTLLEPAPQGFLLGREKLMRALESALKQHNLTPKVIHVRFLDDASLAAGRLAKKIGAKLVATITPDPHRQLCDLSGNIRRFTEEEALTYLNKILIGDMLVEMADGILAIGKKTIEKELLPYYPQLEDTRGRLIQGIDEGVRSFIKTENLNLQDLLLDNDLKYSLSPQNWDRPTLLCIGRLAGIKNQPALLKAWSHSLWEEYNLVFIGGDHTNPTEEEKTILIGIDEVLIEKPEIRGSFVHLPGRSNHDIRNIQKFFAGSNRGKPHFYICPSLKEEFGLSILEAMSVGMVVCAPLKGGAGTYIRHGINGFLIDTSSKQTLQAELEGLILGNRLSPSKAFAIGENAARTVSEQYSMETIAGEFADFYRRVIDG